MAETRKVTFGTDTWKQGTRGNILHPSASSRPWLVNMRLYPDGGLGPRPRWKRWGQTASGGATTYSANIAALAFARATIHTTGLFNQVGLVASQTGRSDFYYISGTHTSLTGVATGSVTGSVGGTYIDRASEYVWLIDGVQITLNGSTNLAASSAVTAMAAAFGFTSTDWRQTGQAIHQTRAFYSGPTIPALAAGSITNPQRVYYSDAGAFTTFSSAAQFFDVDGYVAGMASTATNLLIWTRGGTLYALQGRGNPANGTLTKLGEVPISAIEGTPIMVRDSVLFQRQGRHGIVSYGPGGSVDDSSLAPLAFVGTADTNPSAVQVDLGSGSSRHGTALIPDKHSNAAAYSLNWGAWSYETWGVNTKTVSYVGVDDTRLHEALFVYEGGVGWYVYDRPMFISAPQPNVTGDAFSETPTGIVRLPRIEDDQYDVKVSRVTIDARYWKGSSYETLDMDVLVATGFDGPTATFVQGPDEGVIADLENGSGIEVRLEFTPNGSMPASHMNDVVIQNIMGFVIDSVTVEYEIVKGWS